MTFPSPPTPAPPPPDPAQPLADPAQPLTGQRILVTGASADSDIGLAICRHLATAGARLVLTGRRLAPLEETRQQLAEPERHRIAPRDLTADPDSLPAWLRTLADADGPFSGLVHSASRQSYSPLRTVTAAQCHDTFALNVSVALLLVRALQQRHVAALPASVVLLGSAAGSRGQKGRALYAASKAALAALARSLALELAARPIRVNVVAPAVVAGRQAERQFALLSPEQNQALAAAHPLGYGTPDAVARAVAFLLDPVQSGWITGTVLAVDGGYAAG
mgnify:CR=1 FL=1